MKVSTTLNVSAEYLFSRLVDNAVYDIKQETGKSISAESLDDQCQELIAKANENGGNDNITVLLADFSSKDGDMP